MSQYSSRGTKKCEEPLLGTDPIYLTAIYSFVKGHGDSSMRTKVKFDVGSYLAQI